MKKIGILQLFKSINGMQNFENLSFENQPESILALRYVSTCIPVLDFRLCRDKQTLPLKQHIHEFIYMLQTLYHQGMEKLWETMSAAGSTAYT